MTISSLSRLALLVASISLWPADTVTAARCGPDSIAGAGFESLAGVTIRGSVIPLSNGTVELRRGDVVLASAALTLGNFDITIPPQPPEAMLELRARGLASENRDYIELASYVGTLQQLRDEAETSGIAGVGGVPTLAVSAESTARYALLRAEIAGRPAHECALAARSAALDVAAVRERTAVIKLMIDNGGSYVARKATGNSTLDTVTSSVLLQAQIDAIEQDTPGALASVVALLGEAFCDYFDPEALMVLANGDEQLNTVSGETYERIDATRGRHSDRFGADGISHACSGDVYEATFDGDRVSLNFPVREVNGVFRQVREERRSVSARITRLDSSPGTIAVGIQQVNEATYPFEPTLPDVTASGSYRLDLVRERSAAPFVANALEGNEYLMPTRLELTNQSSRDFEFERLSFGAGGVGQALDVNTAMQWQVNVAGELLLDLPTRDVRVIPLRDEPGAVSALVIVDRQDGSRAVNQGWIVRRDVAVAWPAVEQMPASYVQNAGRVVLYDNTGPFRWDFSADRRAPTFTTTLSGVFPGFVLHWSRPDDQTIVLRQCGGDNGSGGYIEKVVVDRDPAVGECGIRYRERRWTLFHRETVVDGDYLWMLEDNRDWYEVDPAVTGLDQPQFSFYRVMLYQVRPLPVPKHEDGRVSVAPSTWHAPLALN